MGTIAFALALTVAVDPSSHLCSQIQSRSLRPRHVLELSLRATPDSLPELSRTSPPDGKIGHRARVSWDTATVYAQIFHVVRVDGDSGGLAWREYTRVAVVWWRLGLQCQRMTPKPAVRPDRGEVFLPVIAVASADSLNAVARTLMAELRPQGQWIGEVPTFDVSDGAWIYSPTERRPVNLPPSILQSLSVAEYRDMFARLPVIGASLDEWRRSRRELQVWGDADSRRWTLYPAGQELCSATINLGGNPEHRGCSWR